MKNKKRNKHKRGEQAKKARRLLADYQMLVDLLSLENLALYVENARLRSALSASEDEDDA